MFSLILKKEILCELEIIIGAGPAGLTKAIGEATIAVMDAYETMFGGPYGSLNHSS